MYFEGETISYGSFRARIDERATALHAAGLKKGDRIAWLGLNHPDVFCLLFAAARLGLILVPLNWRLSQGELETILQDCAPQLLIHDDAFAALARLLDPQAIHHAEPLPKNPALEPLPVATSDPLLIVYTSGSTGTPKGVVLDQKAIIANAAMSVEAHELTPQDRALVVLPLFHVGGLNILPTPAFSIGASVELHPRFDPAAALDALDRSTVAIVVPTVLRAIMARPDWQDRKLANLRALSIGSTDVPNELIYAIHGRGIPLIQIYGATETTPMAIYQRVDTAMDTAGSIGTVGSRCRARLVLDNTDVEDGEVGEIWIKGDNVLQNYWNNPDLTRSELSGGWFKSGDLARRDAAGNFYFTDRLKNVIISGGENIYPAELERILNACDGVEEACVIGCSHEKWGAVPIAVVVSTLSHQDIMDLFRDRLARYKHPHDVLFVDALPRNAMGKIVPGVVKTMVTENREQS